MSASLRSRPPFLHFLPLALMLILMAATHAAAQIPPQKILILDRVTKEERAKGVLRVSRNRSDNEVVMLLLGNGTIDNFENVRFQKRSTLKEDGYLKPRESESILYNRKDKVVGGFRFLYDYDKKEVLYQRLKEDKAVDLETVFPIEGPVADALNLPVFLEKYLPLHEGLMQQAFYLISTEPKMYKVNIVYRGMEPIEINGKQTYVKKIQLISDKGPFSQWLAKFLPKTFMWFSPERPYKWVQYEGPEKGPDSVTVLIQRLIE